MSTNDRRTYRCKFNTARGPLDPLHTIFENPPNHCPVAADCSRYYPTCLASLSRVKTCRGRRGARQGRSRSRRCSLRPLRTAAPGRRRCSEGVGGVETRPLARPPKGTQKKSLDAAVDSGVERRQCRGARQLASRPGSGVGFAGVTVAERWRTLA